VCVCVCVSVCVCICVVKEGSINNPWLSVKYTIFVVLYIRVSLLLMHSRFLMPNTITPKPHVAASFSFHTVSLFL
jgi:hypothetical protein